MKKTKQVLLRVSEEIFDQIKCESRQKKISTNSLLLHFIVSNLGNSKSQTQNSINKQREVKTVRSTIRFTKNESDILSSYAKENGWKLTEEIRYRILGTLGNIAAINAEELKQIRDLRSSINSLGTNVNTIIRENRVVDQEAKNICINLSKQIRQAVIQVEQMLQKNKSRFVMKSR